MSITGLTAPILDDCTFAHFLWTCATQITQHDTGIDDVYVHFDSRSDYYTEQLEETKAELAKVEAMTDTEFDAYRGHLADEAATRLAEANAKRETTVTKLKAMKVKVDAWTPPSPDHESVKGLMLKQLDQVIESNEGPYTWWDKIPTREDFERGRRRDIERCQGEIEKQRTRADEKQAWVKTLRAAVPIPDTKNIIGE